MVMKRKKTFSFAEVMIGALIFALIAGAVFMILNFSDKVWWQDAGLVELQQKVRAVTDGMVREIRQSKPQDVTLDAATNGAKITFKITGNNNNISYYLQNIGGKLYTVREHPAGTQEFLAGDINSLCFCWDSSTNSCSLGCSNVFTIRIDASKVVRQKTLPFSLIEKVRLRND
jgi:hypothetical protein